MTEVIASYQFDLSKPVYLLHPSNKFWEVSRTSLGVKFRVGKLKDGVENNVEQVDKDYANEASAKKSMISKIEEKLTKGYYSKDAKEIKPEKNESLKQKP